MDCHHKCVRDVWGIVNCVYSYTQLTDTLSIIRYDSFYTALPTGDMTTSVCQIGGGEGNARVIERVSVRTQFTFLAGPSIAVEREVHVASRAYQSYRNTIHHYRFIAVPDVRNLLTCFSALTRVLPLLHSFRSHYSVNTRLATTPVHFNPIHTNSK